MIHYLRRLIGMRGAIFAVAVIAICFSLFAFSGEENKDGGVDPQAYAEMMSAKVSDIYDLEAYFTAQQDIFLPINPPYPDFILHQQGYPTVIPFDPDRFPSPLVKGLNVRSENSVPVYGVWIEEDFVTRDAVFRNESGIEIYRLAPPVNYDPFVYAKSLKPDLYSGKYSLSAIQSILRLYDPARIRIHVTLVHEKDVEPYLYVADILAQQAQEEEPGGQMMMMEGDSEEIVFTSMKPTNSIAFIISLPDGMTNDVDVFTCNDLLPATWTFALKNLPYPGTNVLHWTDSNDWLEVGYPVRFYAAGDAETDSDGDGHADAREIMVYLTDPTNSSSRPFNMSGSISYSGPETGSVWVVFVSDSNSWSTAKSTVIPSPTGYTNNEIGNNQSYWVKAFRDVNGSMTYDSWEPWGLYGSSAVLFTQDTSGINITLGDVPSAWGTLDYAGSETGDVYVIAVTVSNSWDTTYQTYMPWLQSSMSETGGEIYLSFPVDYSIIGIPSSNYWIRAFMDVDGDGEFSFGDVGGQFTNIVTTISNRLTGIDFAMNADFDSDGLPDWWEWQYFGDFSQSDTDDSDGDGLYNDDEFSFGADPTNSDSDGDGMKDGDEVSQGFDPTVQNESAAISISFPINGFQPP